ncbi:MAG: hypothetical protein HQK52_09200 [Oligoflexia bacterium]|nr:hypothetical protein [Oligoflexia bacterium]
MKRLKVATSLFLLLFAVEVIASELIDLNLCVRYQRLGGVEAMALVKMGFPSLEDGARPSDEACERIDTFFENVVRAILLHSSSSNGSLSSNDCWLMGAFSGAYQQKFLLESLCGKLPPIDLNLVRVACDHKAREILATGCDREGRIDRQTLLMLQQLSEKSVASSVCQKAINQRMIISAMNGDCGGGR